jgi:5-methylcytosine-specific restriction endonuclease McrA
MPNAAPRVCGYCGLTHLTGERCKLIAARDAARKARFDAKRPNASARGYGADWRKAKAQFLAEHPACSMCGARAAVVDHIRPHRGDQSLFWDRSNWQALCAHCHNSTKQRLERRKEA